MKKNGKARQIKELVTTRDSQGVREIWNTEVKNDKNLAKRKKSKVDKLERRLE
jgi:hypothetical protein